VVRVGGRPEHDRAVDDFLSALPTEPSALVIEGEPGIGKTTLWSSTIAAARARGWVVLAMRAALAESVAAYAGLADLLAQVPPSPFEALPDPQQRALDQVLVRSGTDSPTEPRAVAAGFLTVVHAMSAVAPVLIAVDDIQWVDPSTVFALSYVTRRLPPSVGVLAAHRVTRAADRIGWLQLPQQRSVQRITLQPMTFHEIVALLSERVERRLTRVDMQRINAISGGNPFYALELGHAMDDGVRSGTDLPEGLADLVRVRTDVLDENVRHLLLAVAALAAPTVDVVAAAADIDVASASALLELAEAAGVIDIDGNKVRFTHPLLAHGVYAQAPRATQRAMHRRLAAVVDQPELRARHLALGATSADPHTLAALDDAAKLARRRGAPAAAAELLDLALKLGGDAPERRIRAASHHFDSGDYRRARTALDATIAALEPGRVRASAAGLLATIVMYTDGFGASAELLERFLPETDGDPSQAITMLMALAYALTNVGRRSEGVAHADDAVARAEQFAEPTLVSRTLALRVVLGFMSGSGVATADLQRAIALDDGNSAVPVAFQPRVLNALLMAWTGELEVARGELRAVENARIDSGEESESIFISYHRAMVEIWLGDFASAQRIADASVDRATHLDGGVAQLSGTSIQATLAAFDGRVDEARAVAAASLEASVGTEGANLRSWLYGCLGFLEVSVRDYTAALESLQPVIERLLGDPDNSEIIDTWAVPDAVEALVQLGRLDEAERLVGIVERNGLRLDRAWMRAVAARCRGMILAARGDVDAGIAAVEDAMAQHDRVPMPFERARTQLTLGALLRRTRRKQRATTELAAALAAFEAMGTPLWADRAREELARVTVRASGTTLSPTEQRVADLAASGMTNRAIAAALFVSPKTVDTNLTRIYRKLGVHSRAELARRLSDGAR
jgi:DNA-binding NarL/FixJ family response regulator